MKLDERGIPEVRDGAICADQCPPSPCDLCVGLAANGQASWDFCQLVRTCAATIDWDRVHESHA